MRKFSIVLLLASLLVSVSCMDLKGLYDRIDQLEQKVGELEKLELAQVKNTVDGINTTLNQIKNKVYVESLTETQDGYVIKFTDGKTATIKNGVDGKDATAPTVGVKEADGELVWTVNNEIVKDASGKAVPATVKVPEFKFDNNKWWYRFGDNDQWKDCGEKTGPEPSITETDEFVVITIGDKSIQIPKEVISPAIEGLNHVFTAYTENAEGVKTYANRLFIPVGASVDLKDYFEVEPEGALKSMVDYSFPDDSPFTISDKGILEATGAGSKTVTISAKVNPEIKTTIIIRTCETPNNEEVNSTVTAEEKIMIFEGSWDEYQKMSEFGGTTAWNPFNSSIAGIFNGTLNTRVGMLSATPNAKVTRDNARLHFMFYVGDASVFQPVDLNAGNMLELTSSGAWDVQEIDFDLTKFVPNFKSGWNEVDLALKDATEDASFDPTKANFIRFLCNANTGGKYVAYQIKDLYVYIEEGPVQITIDGDMSDWAKVKGSVNESEGATYLEFKMASDANNIYFYTKRVANSALWNAGGYLYYALDYDNNPATGTGDIWGNTPYECIFVIWPFAGTGDAPAFAEKPLGESMMKPSGSLANYNANGKADASGVELEFSIPRADFPTIPDSEITVYAWGNKSGENMKNFPLKIKL